MTPAPSQATSAAPSRTITATDKGKGKAVAPSPSPAAQERPSTPQRPQRIPWEHPDSPDSHYSPNCGSAYMRDGIRGYTPANSVAASSTAPRKKQATSKENDEGFIRKAPGGHVFYGTGTDAWRQAGLEGMTPKEKQEWKKKQAQERAERELRDQGNDPDWTEDEGKKPSRS